MLCVRYCFVRPFVQGVEPFFGVPVRAVRLACSGVYFLVAKHPAFHWPAGPMLRGQKLHSHALPWLSSGLENSLASERAPASSDVFLSVLRVFGGLQGPSSGELSRPRAAGFMRTARAAVHSARAAVVPVHAFWV